MADKDDCHDKDKDKDTSQKLLTFRDKCFWDFKLEIILHNKQKADQTSGVSQMQRYVCSGWKN